MLALSLASSAVVANNCRRAWRLTRTLAEGAASLLAASWQRDPASVRTIFVPLAGAALERPVSGRDQRRQMGAGWLLGRNVNPAGHGASSPLGSYPGPLPLLPSCTISQESVPTLGRMIALAGGDEGLARILMPLLSDALASQTSGADAEVGRGIRRSGVQRAHMDCTQSHLNAQGHSPWPFLCWKPTVCFQPLLRRPTRWRPTAWPAWPSAALCTTGSGATTM